MDPVVIMGIIIAAPTVVLTLLRANAATAFLALCLGNVLGTYVAGDAVDWLSGYVAPESLTVESIVSLALLWLPVILVAFFMMHTIAPSQRLLNIIPALAVGLL